MRNVNTIEFGGRKAVINSYSDHPVLVKDAAEQRARFSTMYPRATVRLERMADHECMVLAANGVDCHDVGRASEASVWKN